MAKILGIVLLTLLAASAAVSASDLSLGIKAGLADPEHLETALDLGVLVRGKLTPNWRLEGSAEYWGVDFWKDFSINGTGAYEIPVSGTIQPYVGFGTGAHFQSWEFHNYWWNNHYWVDHSETRTFLGLHLLGGADFEISRQAKIITEIKWALITDNDGFDALTITGGVAFKLK